MSKKNSRRGFLKKSALGLGGLSLSQQLGLVPLLKMNKAMAQSAGTQPKNVLFIAVDDLNDWISPLGGYPGVITPNFQRLADMGLVFSNAHTSIPICSASRTATLYGMESIRTGVYTNEDTWEKSPHLVTKPLPKVFKDAGFRTFVAGKVFHGRNGDFHWYGLEDYWTEHFKHWEMQFPLSCRDDCTVDADVKNQAGIKVGWSGFTHEYKDWKQGSWIVDQMLQSTNEGSPFFGAYGIFKPHTPLKVPKEFFQMYQVEQLQYPYNLNKINPNGNHDFSNMADFLDLPESSREFARQNYIKKALNNALNGSDQNYKTVVHGYLAAVSFADACLGQVLDALLQERDIVENGSTVRKRLIDDTLVVLWSDHGWQLGEKLAWKKSTLWERATRVPLMFAGAGITPGRVEHPVSLMDLYPTLQEVFTGQVDQNLDGQSLAPFFSNPNAPFRLAARTTWHIQFENFNDNQLKKVFTTRPIPPKGVDHKELAFSLRTKNYRYIRYNDENGDARHRELYNTSNDPNEWFNLYDPNISLRLQTPKVQHLINVLDKLMPGKERVPGVGIV